jgi:hypothetical protein
MAKKRLGTGYTFTAASKTVTHADFSDITLAGIQLIVNVTDQIIIYSFADTTKGGTLSTDTLTLEYDTTSMSDTDELMILVEDGIATQGITASSLPLPSGASTSANQTTIIGHLDGVEGLLTTIDADTGNISTKIDTLAGAVAGTEMQVDVLTMPTVTVNAHAVTNAGTFVVQENGAALTALQLIDDTVQVLGTDTYTEATSKGITLGAVRRDADTTLVNTTNEFTPLQVDANGRLKVEAFSGETLPVTLTSTTITGTVAVTQSGTWDEVGINDSGNSITVDNGGTFAVQVDGSALTSLQLIDDTVFTAGTSTYSEATSKGNLLLAVRRDADTTLVDTTNEMSPLQVNAAGQLKVEIFTGGETFAVLDTNSAAALTALQLIDDIVYTDDTSTHSTGTSKGALMMAAATPTDTAVNANDIGAVGMTNNRELYVSLRDIAGATAVTGSGTATGALRVELPNNGTGVIATVSTVTAMGTGTTGPMKAEDVAHATGDQGFAVWAVSNEANTARAADGDYLPIASDTEGNVRIVGNRDSDAIDAGEPVKVGGQARQTNPTAVADADRVNFIADDLGRQVVVTGQVRDLIVQQVTTITSSTSETTILTAGAAGVFHDLKALMVANKSASATLITIRDATAGSAIAYIHCPAGDTRGVVFTTPFKQTTAANNWTAQCGTSVDSVYITVQAEKNV